MKSLFLVCLFLSSVLAASAQKERSLIENKYKVNLTPVYPSDQAWEAAKQKLITEMPNIEQYKGKLTQSASKLLECLEFSTKLDKESSRLYIYTSLNSDVDTRDMKFMSMQQSLDQLLNDYSTKTAFIEPELLKVDWKVIEGFINKEKGLEIYRKDLTDLFKKKQHTLSEPEERILARSSMIGSVANDVYGTF